MPHFEELLGRSSDAVFVVGSGFRIVWWGSRAEQVLGLPSTGAVGRRCFDLFAGSGEVGRTICGPDCWAVRALKRGQTPMAFCMDLCIAGAQQRAFTLGFLVDESGKFLVHVLRERDTSGSSSGAPQSGAADAEQIASPAEVARLTPRQRQVLELIRSGATSVEIARNLVVSHATARNHVQNVLVKLGVHSRLEAALLA
jgi:DNA-binding CsgD family transcriptional regulator